MSCHGSISSMVAWGEGEGREKEGEIGIDRGIDR